MGLPEFPSTFFDSPSPQRCPLDNSGKTGKGGGIKQFSRCFCATNHVAWLYFSVGAPTYLEEICGTMGHVYND
jgi:hypothetical protein